MRKNVSNANKILVHRSKLHANSNTSFFKFGFTLVELLIVMSVLGAMAALFIVNYPASQRRARDTIRRSDIKQYQTALEVYASKNNGQYPTSGSNLKAMCNTLIGPGGTCPDDPRTPGNYNYVPSGGTAYRLWVPLEYMPSGVQQYFVVFSTGNTCTSNSNSVCP